MNPGELETRIQQLLDGDLHPDHWPALRETLEQSAEARRIYAEHARIHTQLLRIRRERSSLRTGLVPVERMLDLQRGRQLKFAGLAAAAVIALTAVIMQFVRVQNRSLPVELTAGPGSRFMIVHPGETNAASSPALRKGSRLTLDQGVLELKFESGVRSVVRGPADLTLTSSGELKLDTGCAWFQVPRRAAGFQVRTPRVTVTDLGTEFGVIARPDFADSVHLFKGSIRIDCHDGFRESATLTGSGARDLTSTGRLTPSAPRLDRFFTKLPDHLPWMGWTFDEASPAEWKAIGTMPEAGALKASVLPEKTFISPSPGRFGNGLFSPGFNGWWETDWAGVPGNAPRTLAFWLLLPHRDDYLHPIAGWGLRYEKNSTSLGSFFVLVEYTGEGSVAGVSLGGYWIKGSTPVDDSRWHHIAVTSSGRFRPDGTPDVKLYIDGRPETYTAFFNPDASFTPEQPLVPDTDVTHPDSQPLSVLSHLFADRQGDHPFPAALDELRVYEAALNASQIESLFRNNHLPAESGTIDSDPIPHE